MRTANFRHQMTSDGSTREIGMIIWLDTQDPVIAEERSTHLLAELTTSVPRQPDEIQPPDDVLPVGAATHTDHTAPGV